MVIKTNDLPEGMQVELDGVIYVGPNSKEEKKKEAY